MSVSKEQVAKKLERDVVEIVSDAIRALEMNQSTAYARSQLKEVERRLKQLEFEYRGGCSW